MWTNWEKLNFEESTVNIFTSKLFWDEGRLLAVYLPDQTQLMHLNEPTLIPCTRKKGGIWAFLVNFFMLLMYNPAKKRMTKHTELERWIENVEEKCKTSSNSVIFHIVSKFLHKKDICHVNICFNIHLVHCTICTGS